MSHPTNLKGEQGGKTLGSGDQYLATEDRATGFAVITDGTTLASITSNYVGDDTKLINVPLNPGFYPGRITELTVDSGLVRVNDGSKA